MDLVSFELRLSDGRSLDVEVSGPDGATPLVVHHGTPGERSQYPPFAAAAAAKGLRYVSYSRPGYGGSSRQPGRAVADWAADTAAILAHLSADRCYTVGASGGGPHALACAALSADRVLACATVAGVGPFGAEGLDFLQGMGRENHEEFGAALAGPAELQAYLEREAASLAEITGQRVATAFGDLVSAVDVAALTGDFAAFVAASFLVAPPASSARSRVPPPAANHSATMNITKSGWSIRTVRIGSYPEVDPVCRAAYAACQRGSQSPGRA
jgi:pimeloyl-ACP methyl ester carboxylesterase